MPPPAGRRNWQAFAGQVSNVDPHDVPAGAMVSQINLTNIVPGQLTVRRGMRKISFASGTTGTSATAVVSLVEFNRPESQFVAFATSDGRIVAGRTPA